MATATAVALAGSTAVSVVQQRQARKESKRAAAIERRAAEVRNLRERKKALAARQRTAAQAATAGQQAGISVASGVIQAEQSSAGAQFGSNVGFAQELSSLNARRLGALDNANAAQGRAGIAQSFGSAFSGVSQSFQRAKAQQAALLKRSK